MTPWKHPIKRLTLLIAFGVGYLLGARAGRARYEQIVDSARRVAGNPKVQAAAGRAQEKVSDTFGHDDHVARPSSPAGQPLG